MRRVGVATCDQKNIDPDSPVLLAALREVGLDAQLCAWDDPLVDWDRFDLVVVRSTWDYAPRRDTFLAWAQRLARVDNPYPVLAYSSDKHYLADLAARGHRVVPSHFCDVGALAVLPEGDFVVKPCVGAGSIDAQRYSAHQHEVALAHVASLHARGGDALIQPYVASVDERGERALIFLDGEFSHAMTKAAMLNVAASTRDPSFRRNQMSIAEGEVDAVTFASEVLEDAGCTSLLYARVDLVLTEEGWALMELELVEPSLFLSFAPSAPGRLARAVARRVGA